MSIRLASIKVILFAVLEFMYVGTLTKNALSEIWDNIEDAKAFNSGHNYFSLCFNVICF